MTVKQIPQMPPRPAVLVSPDGGPAQNWYGFFRQVFLTVNGNLKAGFSGTISLAKLTTGGANGSITVVSGIITAVTPPT
jgi:hypothetical protein